MRIAVLEAQLPFGRPETDGARAGERLCQEFRAQGHEAIRVRIPFSDERPEAIVDQMLAVRLLHLEHAERAIGLDFPAYLIRHPDLVVWALHRFGPAYEDDPPDGGALPRSALGRAVRRAVLAAEHAHLREAARVYARSPAAARSLRDTLGLDAGVLQLPLTDGDADITWERVAAELTR